MAINCCKGCVPPKRTPTCKFDGTCNLYAEAKEKHELERAAERKKRDIEAGLSAQYMTSMTRAYKNQRRMKGR
jgi:hypothetical protein